MKDKTSKLVLNFYKKLGSKYMLSLTNKGRDEATSDFILTFLKKSDKILDLVCGFRRITLMLRKLKFKVEDIDLSQNL